MEVHMTRRKTLIAAILGSVVLGSAAMIGLADQFTVFAEDDAGTLANALKTAKISLQQGLAASEKEGRPISAKFEVEDGKLQLSVYTAKDGKFFEVIVDHATGTIAKVEPITEGEDLAHAKAQSAALTNAKKSLKEAVYKAAGPSARAVSVTPDLKDGHPVASVAVLTDGRLRNSSEPLD
jgi:hypothetical protein